MNKQQRSPLKKAAKRQRVPGCALLEQTGNNAAGSVRHAQLPVAFLQKRAADFWLPRFSPTGSCSWNQVCLEVWGRTWESLKVIAVVVPCPKIRREFVNFSGIKLPRYSF